MDTHNLNCAINLILKEEGISEVKRVKIREKNNNSTIFY